MTSPLPVLIGGIRAPAMQEMLNRSYQRGRMLLPLLFAFTLFMRMVVPAGWMPVADNGFNIVLCTGSGTVNAWVDADGNIHKQNPDANGKTDSPCVFAGLGCPFMAPLAIGAALPLFIPVTSEVASLLTQVTVGQGLVAPPPPPTGPPASL